MTLQLYWKYRYVTNERKKKCNYFKGVRGLYCGLVPHMWRDGPGYGVYMVIYEETHPSKPFVTNCNEMPEWVFSIQCLFLSESYKKTSTVSFFLSV